MKESERIIRRHYHRLSDTELWSMYDTSNDQYARAELEERGWDTDPYEPSYEDWMEWRAASCGMSYEAYQAMLNGVI